MIPGAHLLAWLVVDFVEIASHRGVGSAWRLYPEWPDDEVMISPSQVTGLVDVVAHLGPLRCRTTFATGALSAIRRYDPPFLIGAAA